ncbi:TraB/GumN family protein [Altererythrobacter xixiisoli]|uniref:TraB/GumN family protein n=1 Tax=Croceibacterium xixiisoli TaxID=1476466 RepID=A0A6I4TVX3_9SPHN|nr:TraB/GumN family protein [Croceibacterium xixiisoli]MXO99972.1 TraB/GumN family protein [Croceibacterium xixiisoli]
MNIVLKNVLGCALALCLLALTACNNAATDTDDAVAQHAGSPAIWHVRSAEGHEAWLFGTIHALPDNIRWRSSTLEAALLASGLMVVEIDNLADSAAARRALQDRAYTASLPPLSQRIAATDREPLRAIYSATGLSDRDLAGVEDWAAALMIANARRTNQTDNGVDKALLDGSRPVHGLEGFERQFDRFDRLSPADQAALLSSVISEPDDPEKTELVSAWIKGDMNALESQSNSGFLTVPGLRQALLVDRNHDWATQIDGLIRQDQRPFVAVGAAHMLGPDGLPALLAARGYTVSRLQ